MITEQNKNLYQEYADMMARKNGDYFNTTEFGDKLADSPVWKWTDKLATYNQKILNRVLGELKTHQEWQDAEADDSRPTAYGAWSCWNNIRCLHKFQRMLLKKQHFLQ